MKAKNPTKAFTLISGNEQGWSWNIQTKIKENGSFANKGVITIRKRPKSKIESRYYSAIHSLGMCLFCGEIDWRVLEEHHPDKEKMPDFTITLCANDHRRVHWDRGYRTKGGKRQ